jgi:hypothetical protein
MSQGILSLAKQGNPRAIAALINHSTKPQGITVQVARQEDCLHILFESNRAPNQQDAVALIGNSMRILKVEPIHVVKVYGRQHGEKAVSWSEVLHLAKPSVEPRTDEFAVKRRSSNVSANVPNQSETSKSPTVIAPLPNQSKSEIGLAASQADLEKAIPTGAIEPSPDDTEGSVQAFLRRPEAVILIIFVSMIMLWQFYLDLLESVESTSLSGRELAERLGTNQSTISRRKDQEDFGEWTQTLDPDGIAWIYQNPSFVPKLQSD